MSFSFKKTNHVLPPFNYKVINSNIFSNRYLQQYISRNLLEPIRILSSHIPLELRLSGWSPAVLELVSLLDPAGLGAPELLVDGEALPLLADDLLMEEFSFGLGRGVGESPLPPPVLTCCLHLALLFLNQT